MTLSFRMQIAGLPLATLFWKSLEIFSPFFQDLDRLWKDYRALKVLEFDVREVLEIQITQTEDYPVASW